MSGRAVAFSITSGGEFVCTGGKDKITVTTESLKELGNIKIKDELYGELGVGDNRPLVIKPAPETITTISSRSVIEDECPELEETSSYKEVELDRAKEEPKASFEDLFVDGLSKHSSAVRDSSIEIGEIPEGIDFPIEEMELVKSSYCFECPMTMGEELEKRLVTYEQMLESCSKLKIVGFSKYNFDLNFCVKSGKYLLQLKIVLQ